MAQTAAYPDFSSQLELFLEDTSAGLVQEPSVPATLDLFYEIGALWGLPVGMPAQLTLRDHQMSVLSGCVQLAQLPDLPYNPTRPLALVVAGFSFCSRQVVSWHLL